MATGYSLGNLPGENLTRRNRLAQMLTSGPNVNNGSTYGGLAHALQQGLSGYLQGADSRDKQAAQSAMMQALLAGPTQTQQLPPDFMGPPNQRTVSPYENAATAMAGLGDNEYAAQYAVPLAMKQYEAEAARTEAERKRANEMEDYRRKLEIKSQYPGVDSGAKFGNSPLWGEDAQGNPVIMQLSNQGGVQQVQMPQGVTPMRGGTSKVDLGDKFGVLDANGSLIGYIPKGIAPEQMPEFKGAQIAAQEAAKTASVAEQQQRRAIGKAIGESNMALYETATKSVDAIAKANDLINHIEKSGATTGIGAELFNNINRVKALMGSDVAAGKVSDTELLDSMMGTEVFGMISALGIGAKGLDTPAEREFLRSVMTGKITLNKDTLVRMAKIRRDISQRSIDKWNAKTNAGDLDVFYEATGLEKRPIGSDTQSNSPSTPSDIRSQADAILRGQ